MLPAMSQMKEFSPAPPDNAYLASLSDKYFHRYKEHIDKLPSQNKKDLVEVYQHRWENIKEKFDKKEIYTSRVAQDYLDRLVAVIKKGNPMVVNAEFSCYFSRSAIPNASYIGEGVILFNMGLFERLDNESEAAFILCHEMAHFLLHHSENAIDQYVAKLNSEEVQAQLRQIRKSEYQKHEQVQKLIKGLTFDSRRHSRDHEAQADSMAAQLMRNTPFALGGGLSTLALLDVIDIDTLNTSLCLPAVFNAPEYPFRKKWIMKNEGLMGAHARIKDTVMADSLKTHPDCQRRIGWLSQLTKGWPQPGAKKFLVDSSAFAGLRKTFRYETIEYAFEANEYARSFFLTLEQLQTSPEDPYLVTQIGRVFNGIYTAQKAHTLGKVVDLPSPYFPTNYNLLLQFIQNLYLEDIASINFYYLKKYHPKMDAYTPYRTAYQQSEQLVKTN